MAEMFSEKIFLAFDTSNYTTSCAICAIDGTVIKNLKLPLPVGDGERGLRQSEALFHHVNRLPDLLDKLEPEGEIMAVGYSASPREVVGSYMPCFLAGRAVASAVAKANNLPLYSFSHQNGHIMAALYSAGRTDLIGKEFYAFHVSGGTTEILKVTPNDQRIISSKKIGGTLDLNAGQVIDRVGVMMGLNFPCGKAMEMYASEYKGKIDNYKISVKGITCNLSGIENRATALYNETKDKNRVSAFVLNAIKNTLKKMTENLLDEICQLPVVYAGGVMSCSLIRKELNCFGSFSEPEYSCDNAAGCSLLTRMAFLNNLEH